MVRMTWSSLSASGPAFHVFRRDDAVFRTLQGSQVAVHEYRMAYDNLLIATNRERNDLVRDKRQLEEELRILTIAKAEADRLLKGQISGLHAGLRASEQAYSELDAEHQQLQHTSSEVTNGLLERIDRLQQTVADLQAEGQSLQAQLASVQAEAALKDAAMQHVAKLQTSMAALQQRARQLVSDLKHSKNKSEKRIAELSSNLSATQQQLAQENAARTSNDDVVRRLAWERDKLASALELERLINEPLRHTTYAITTTMAHLMRSPIASTVRDRASPDRHLDQLPHQQLQKDHSLGPLVLPYSPDIIRIRRPGSAPPAAEATAAAAHSSKVGSRVTLSPLPGQREAASPGYITGRNLTRLGRSWATTTATAGSPNSYFLDNLNSYLSPPPPGPPRKPVPLCTPSYTPRPGQSQRSGSSCAVRSVSSSFDASGTGVAAGNGGHRYVPPQYLTNMLRSPGTQFVQDSIASCSDEVRTPDPPSPAFLWGGRVPATPSSESKATWAPSSPSYRGRSALRDGTKEAWSGDTAPPAVLTLGGTPVTIAYG